MSLVSVQIVNMELGKGIFCRFLNFVRSRLRLSISAHIFLGNLICILTCFGCFEFGRQQTVGEFAAPLLCLSS